MTNKRQHKSSLLQQLLLCSAAVVMPFYAFAESYTAHTLPDGMVEISIPLADTIDYTLENKNKELYLSFSEPLAGQMKTIAEKLPDLMLPPQVDENGKGILMKVKDTVSIQNFRNNGQLIIRLNKQKKELADLSIDNRLGNVPLNYGKHTDYARFTFDFSDKEKPQYTVTTNDLATTISFNKNFNITSDTLKNYDQANYILRQITPDGKLNIIFPAKLVNSFEHKNKIVFDINNTPIPADEDIISPAQTAPVTKQSQNKMQMQASLTTAQASSIQPSQISSLSFSWNMPVGLSVFQRGKYIWIVFDHPQKLDMEELKKTTTDVADEIIQLPHPSATILRISPKSKLNTFVRKEGLLWIVDLFSQDAPEEIKDLPVYTQYNVNNDPYLFIPSDDAGNVVSIIDPEVGDLIVAGTGTDIGFGIKNGYTYPDLTLLPTTQGIAFNADAMDIALSRGNTGYTIQAVRRGLNISSNLEQLKQQEQLNQIDNSAASLTADLSREDKGKTFIEEEDSLKQNIVQAAPEQKNKAQMELAKYYITQGLGTNALGILNKLAAQKAPEAQTERFYGMLGVAQLLSHRYEQAIESFSYGSLPESNAGVFWRTLASSALTVKPENNAVLVSYLNTIRSYPPQIRKMIAEIAARTAIAARDDITAQSFIDILKTMKTSQDLTPQINYLTAEKMLMQGYPRNAIQEYRKAANSKDIKYAALSRKKIVDLEAQLNAITPQKAIKELEGLRFSWGEHNFKKQVLSDLSNFYVKNHDYYQALRTLQDLERISSPDEQKKVEKRMVKLFEDIYLNNQADNLNALKALALYHDYNWLAPKSQNYNGIVQKLADRLVAVDLLDRAFELLETQMKTQTLTPEEKASYGSRMALIHLFNDKNREAIAILDQTEVTNIPETLALQRRIIRAKAFAGIGNADQALALLKNDYSKNALLLKSEIFWNGNLWGDAADAIKYLIEKPTPGKPLSLEQINYILDWATALKKAGRETVIVRLRNKFMPWFKDTKYYSAFSILTDTLENNQINIRVIDRAINDVETFSNFAKIYNQALINSSLTETGTASNNE